MWNARFPGEVLLVLSLLSSFNCRLVIQEIYTKFVIKVEPSSKTSNDNNLSFCENFSAFIADKGLRSFGTRHN